MNYVVAAGTDVASLLLFDPWSLPEEFDSVDGNNDRTEILIDLDSQGHLFWINTDADGEYLLHAFIDEEPPRELQRYICEPVTKERFAVTSGNVFFLGAEYGFRKDDSHFRRYPDMGGSFPAENGTYTITLSRTEYPDGLHEERFRQKATPLQQRVHGLFSTLLTLVGVSGVITVVAFFLTSWTTWCIWFLPVVIATVFLAWLVSRFSAFQEADAIWESVNSELPSLVAMMSRNIE